MTGETGGDMQVEDVPRTESPRCQCDDCQPCRNAAALDPDVVAAPALCTPCLFGCAP